MPQVFSSPEPGTHDLRLSSWGPYAKKYFGISHRCAGDQGLRFDVCVVPGRFRSEFFAPDALLPCGYLPWAAEPDLSRYSYRQQMGADRLVHADVDFQRDETGASIRIEFVNQSELPESLCVHFCGWLNFPPLRPRSDEILHMARVVLPEGAYWLDALEYDSLKIQSQGYWSHLVEDAALFGEIRANGFVDGQGLGMGFGKTPGDEACYVLAGNFARGTIRFRSVTAAHATCRISSGGVPREVSASGELTSAFFEIDQGATRLVIEPDGEVEIDGIALLPDPCGGKVRFEEISWNSRPTLQKMDRGVTLRYENLPESEYVMESDEPFVFRSLLADSVRAGVHASLHNHVDEVLDAGGRQQITDLYVGPINVAPGTKREVRFRVRHQSEVADALLTVPSLPPRITNREGEAFSFGYQRLRAVLLTNVVYPTRVKGRWARHYTPGRWWDCLYTWDSGFIGLGLLECDVHRAVDCLNAYLTEPGDPHAAFVHHGSMVPMQIYLLQELWNRTRCRELLAFFYPRALQQHHFIAGISEGSRTAALKSGLLKTWDYFYNSGGWDDYPPQENLRHRPKVRNRVAPVITTSHLVRCSRILADLGKILNKDVTALEQTETHLVQALIRHAWTDEDGIFSYVEHDENGQPIGPFRTKDGVNFNFGLDGLSPLFAADLPARIRRRLLDALFDEKRFWTEMGLTVVDRSAPYASDGGYWNGTVWMPYQWIFWRALLDLGEGEKAQELALRALGLWEKEVRASETCPEHFLLATGRGCGWHHFGALSSPIVNWFSAYFQQGSLTAGFNATMLEVHWGPEFTRCDFSVRVQGSAGIHPVVVACLDSRFRYSIQGDLSDFRILHPGTMEIRLPENSGDFVVSIQAVAA